MAVVALMLFLTHISGCIGALEQSITSSMHKAPPMCTVLSYIGATRVVTSHGAFGGETRKMLQLFSPAKLFLSKMQRKAPKRTVGPDASLVSRKGKRFTGKAKNMKISQRYTPAYGRAFADAYLAQRAALNV